MFGASYSHTKHLFDVSMQNLKDESEEAWAWLSKIPVECWARYAMDTNCKTDLVVNNLSEGFNKMILDVRGKPILTMFEGIRTKLMMRYEKKRTGAASGRWEITPTYCEILEESMKYSRNYKSMKYVGNLWQVSRGVESSYDFFVLRNLHIFNIGEEQYNKHTQAHTAGTEPEQQLPS